MTPEEFVSAGLLPAGFMPLPHVKQPTGGQVFRTGRSRRSSSGSIVTLRASTSTSIFRIISRRNFRRRCFSPRSRIWATCRKASLLTIKNFYELMNGIITPVQMEGLRLLLTPFPQEEFNQTEDRKVAGQSLGVTCLDCHTNFHTNARFPPETGRAGRRRPLPARNDKPAGHVQPADPRFETSLRPIEDFTEFEQRTAYFDGDQVSATRKGVHLPDRPNQVAMMAQMQNIFDFPPAPKLDPFGRLDPAKATRTGARWRKSFHRQGPVRRMPHAADVIHRQQDARSEAGAVLSDRPDRRMISCCSRTARSRRSRCAASRIRRLTFTTAGC